MRGRRVSSPLGVVLDNDPLELIPDAPMGLPNRGSSLRRTQRVSGKTLSPSARAAARRRRSQVATVSSPPGRRSAAATCRASRLRSSRASASSVARSQAVIDLDHAERDPARSRYCSPSSESSSSVSAQPDSACTACVPSNPCERPRRGRELPAGNAAWGCLTSCSGSLASMLTARMRRSPVMRRGTSGAKQGRGRFVTLNVIRRRGVVTGVRALAANVCEWID
jgi:hypothetical protein